MKKIEVSEAALDTLQRMVEELQAERDALFVCLNKVQSTLRFGQDVQHADRLICDAIDAING